MNPTSAAEATTTAGIVGGRSSPGERGSAGGRGSANERGREGVTSWLGVPYAAPPVGPLRFRAPQSPVRWEGVRPATHVAGAATQRPGPTAPEARLGSGLGEDCLYLNVYRPDTGPGSATDTHTDTDSAGRPVLVWLHGGAFVSGSGALYDGRHLAALGDIVVVTVNYRLGVFGFADLGPCTGAEIPSNLGLRDAIAALEWVRDNVAAFGGDPGKVTVAGESAGSILVSLLMCAPGAEGLFRAAICQSGSYSLIHGDGVRAEVARRYANELGITRGGGAALWEVSAQQLLAAQDAVDASLHAVTAAAPWFDGDVVPGSLEEARAATRTDIPLLAGSNRDEIVLFRRMSGDILLTDRGEIAERLRDALGGERAEAVLARYPRTRAGEVSLSTDLNFAMPTANLAERHAAAGGVTFGYRFDAATPWLGACHAAELPYLWDWTGPAALVLRGRMTPAKRSLAGRMQRHWVDFVREGRPGAQWPAHQLPDRATLILDPAGDRVEADPAAYRRVGWAGADVMPHP